MYPGWRVVAASFFGVLTGYSVLIPYTFGLFLKPLSSAFGWGRDQVSVALACVAITVALCSPVTGRLLDRFGPRRVVLPCIIAFSLGFASLAFLTSHLWHFYLVFLLLGLAGNGTTQLAYSRAIATWFLEHRGKALSAIAAGAGVGTMMLPLLAAWLIDKYGWRFAYGTLGALAFGISFPLTALFLRESELDFGQVSTSAPESQMNAKEGMHGRANDTLGSAARSLPFLLLVAAIFFYSVTFNGILSHLPALLSDRGFSVASVAMAIPILGACGLAGRLLTGYLLDRFFAPTISLCLFLSTVAGVLLLSLPSSAASPLLCAAILGLAAGGESDITPYLISRYFNLKIFSTLYGLAWTAYAAGTAVGPFLMGRLYTVTGAYQSWGVRLFALPTFLSAIAMALMPSYAASGNEKKERDVVKGIDAGILSPFHASPKRENDNKPSRSNRFAEQQGQPFEES